MNAQTFEAIARTGLNNSQRRRSTQNADASSRPKKQSLKTKLPCAEGCSFTEFDQSGTVAN